MGPKRKRKTVVNHDTNEISDGKSKSKKRKREVEKVEVKTGPQASDRYTCWLMKSEPDTRMENGIDVKFGFEDLKACTDQTSYWDGVRNYQARNFMRDQMKVGDKVFFYHSNTKIPGIVGVCSIVKEAYPDHTQFDKKSSYYDAKSDKDNPRWVMVDVKYEYDLKRYVSLKELKELHISHKANGGPLRNIALFTKTRLSVQPVTEEEWDFICKLSEKPVDA
ncbi:hypothetical protein SNE40_003222 [Patella caerulea]|uniref:Thymocyte nuclear protein 1 n=1 Tax=Patella caerulea TaxID=87958 RepID=A0AAN8Q8D2_PATCE